jgi:heat shock protein HslJ
MMATRSAFAMEHINVATVSRFSLHKSLNIAFYVCLITFSRLSYASLPEELFTPDQRVACNSSWNICYDRMGSSIGLTQIFLGHAMADNLTATLHNAVPPHSHEMSFFPALGVECTRETGPCIEHGMVHEALTAVLFGPWLDARQDTELLDVDWKWTESHYNVDTSIKPADPLLYTIRLAVDGSVRARVDCNRAGGQYRLVSHELTLEITHSTRAACGPDSLNDVFLRDLGKAALFFIKDGMLILNFSNDTGAMKFSR